MDNQNRSVRFHELLELVNVTTSDSHAVWSYRVRTLIMAVLASFLHEEEFPAAGRIFNQMVEGSEEEAFEAAKQFAAGESPYDLRKHVKYLRRPHREDFCIKVFCLHMKADHPDFCKHIREIYQLAMSPHLFRASVYAVWDFCASYEIPAGSIQRLYRRYMDNNAWLESM